MNRITYGCIAVLCLGFATLSNGQTTDLSQYGHQAGWKSESSDSSDTGFELAWKVAVGEGRSQVVVDGDRLFVLAGESEKRAGKEQPLCKTRLLCLDRSSGKEIWKRECEPQERLKGQESFSGATLCPRATPSILGDHIVTVSYTGILECVNKDSGKLTWKKNLVDLGAIPVQFGFSSSPVGNGTDADRFFITAAGPEGGLYCLAAKDGATIWKSECESFSYSTPTFATFDGVRQIIVSTRDEILGIAEADGKRLWKVDFREKGLTNVPSPIVLDDGFVHSSQGSKGTSRVTVALVDGKWSVTEKWYSSRAQFFYTNWTLVKANVAGLPDMIMGVAENLMFALDVNDGSVVGRWRGFANGNLVRVNDLIFMLDGKGSLSVLKPELQDGSPRYEQVQKLAVFKARCWTPPTVVSEGLLVRGGKELALVKFVTGESRIENELEESKPLNLKMN